MKTEVEKNSNWISIAFTKKMQVNSRNTLSRLATTIHLAENQPNFLTFFSITFSGAFAVGWVNVLCKLENQCDWRERGRHVAERKTIEVAPTDKMRTCTSYTSVSEKMDEHTHTESVENTVWSISGIYFGVGWPKRDGHTLWEWACEWNGLAAGASSGLYIATE